MLIDTLNDIAISVNGASKVSAALLDVKLKYVQELNLMNGFNKHNHAMENAITLMYVG